MIAGDQSDIRTADPPRLILIPGLGADHRLFHFQKAAFPHLEVPPWLEPAPRESLAEYGRRMAAAIRPDPARPLVLGGCSFGGMVAQEMARHLPARCVILIGSCREPGAVARHLRNLEFSSRHVPGALINRGRPLAAAMIARAERLPKPQQDLVTAMVDDAPLPLVRWSARAIFEWPGALDLPTPVFAVHGARDTAIRARRAKPQEIIPGAGHILALSHPDRVNSFIASHIAQGPIPTQP